MSNRLSKEERAEVMKAKQAINEEAKENWDDPQWRREMAADLTEVIYEGFDHENLLDLMAEVEYLGSMDRSFVHEVRGLRAFWVGLGGHIHASTLRHEKMEITRETLGFHVSDFEDNLLSNFADSQATLIEHGIKRMDAEVNRRVLSAFQAAIPSGSAYYVSGAGLDLSQLNTAIGAVEDESKTREVVIMGRATMTRQIIDELLGSGNNGAGFLPETNEEMLRRGVLGTYRGARIITLVNHQDSEDISFFPANELYVMAKDASKFAFWGGLKSKDFVEQDNWYWHYLARRDFGGVVHRPERARRIVDTSLPA